MHDAVFFLEPPRESGLSLLTSGGHGWWLQAKMKQEKKKQKRNGWHLQVCQYLGPGLQDLDYLSDLTCWPGNLSLSRAGSSCCCACRGRAIIWRGELQLLSGSLSDSFLRSCDAMRCIWDKKQEKDRVWILTTLCLCFRNSEFKERNTGRRCCCCAAQRGPLHSTYSGHKGNCTSRVLELVVLHLHCSTLYSYSIECTLYTVNWGSSDVKFWPLLGTEDFQLYYWKQQGNVEWAELSNASSISAHITRNTSMKN